jgi:hypothetical protein
MVLRCFTLNGKYFSKVCSFYCCWEHVPFYSLLESKFSTKLRENSVWIVKIKSKFGIKYSRLLSYYKDITSVHTSRAHAEENNLRLHRQQPKTPGKIAHAGPWTHRGHGHFRCGPISNIVVYYLVDPGDIQHDARIQSENENKWRVAVKTLYAKATFSVRVIVSLVSLNRRYMTRCSWLRLACSLSSVQLYKSISNSSNRFSKRAGTTPRQSIRLSVHLLQPKFRCRSPSDTGPCLFRWNLVAADANVDLLWEKNTILLLKIVLK